MRGIFCFRNDLRLTDHPALNLALKKCETLYLVYVFEDRVWKANPQSRIGPFRANFILESLIALKKEIEKLGGSLHCLQGRIEEEIPRFMESMGCTHCFLQQEDAWEECQTEKYLSTRTNLTSINGATLIRPVDLPCKIEELPSTFTQFRKLIEEDLKVIEPVEIIQNLEICHHPNKDLSLLDEQKISPPNLDPRTPFIFVGGSDSGKKRIDEWFWSENALCSYKSTRNGLLGASFSSRLSPWLAQGCLSPREIYYEVKRYEAERGANQSTYWLFFELLWRDYFHFLARKYGPKIFQKKGLHPDRSNKCLSSKSLDLFNAWKYGKTNDRFVNANMNELRLSGWMSNRGRQNVASYLIHDLGVDWRWGARWFESKLIDFDPCSNYCNWLYLAGYGNDPRPNRSFNLVKQANLYDPNGQYQELWS